MKRAVCLVLIVLSFATSCNGPGTSKNERVVTVSIPPFKYFVEAIADSDFVVNVMLPQGADHHSWEPLPGQITALAGSEAFLSDGYLGFEYAWLERFKEVNPKMKIINLSSGISLIEPLAEGESHGHDHQEGVDPHYWLSPKTGYAIAENVKRLVTELNPSQSIRYEENYSRLIERIAEIDTIVASNIKQAPSSSFMIFHPALTYMARDYDLEQISFEDEGKMPSPARMKELVDLTREKGMKIILIQAEYDIKSAEVLASETGARLVVINPMSPEWDKCIIEISEALAGKVKQQ